MAVTLIIKGTRLCNLRCTYCHDWRQGPDQTMKFAILARMTASVLGDPTHDKVSFIWHGGETTILPISFYEKAMLLQHRFRRPGQEIQNMLQTNGTRITREWAQFFRENDIGIGISIDGPPEIHNQYRIYADGRGSWDAVVQGIRLLDEFEIPYSVLMVIDEGAIAMGARRIFEFLVGQGIKRFGFLNAKPVNQPGAGPNTPTEHYVNPARMNQFLMDAYEIWEDYGDAQVIIRELDILRQRLGGGNGTPCTLIGGCLGTFFLIEPDGQVAHCDLFLGDSRYTLGNIMTDDFPTMRRSQALRSLQEENGRALDQMRTHCPEFDVCSGWCPHERYLSVKHNPQHTADCCGLGPLIRFIRSRMEKEIPGRLPLANRSWFPARSREQKLLNILT
jgi:uncharacterized protein